MMLLQCFQLVTAMEDTAGVQMNSGMHSPSVLVYPVPGDTVPEATNYTGTSTHKKKT